MDYNGYIISDEQKDIQQMVQDFADKQIMPRAAEFDVKGELDWESYNKACEMGLLCPDIPEEFGGSGMDAMTCAIIREELMRGDAGFGLTLGTNGLGIKPILLAGSPEQKQMAADTILSDKPGRDPRWPKKRFGFAAFALTEPDAGSDAGACRTTAEKVGNEYVINGRKCFITNACYADIFTVIASVDRSLGYKGLTMFLVDAHAPGVSIGKHEDKMGIRQSATCDIIFDNVHIPEENLIGEVGKGFNIAMKTLEQGRAAIGSSCCGIMRAAFELAVKYAQERTSMGKPIYKNQGILYKLADMQIAIETTRQIGLYVAALVDAKDPKASVMGPIAKCYGSDALQKVVTEAVQILGGYGYMRDYPAEKLMRDAKIFQIFEGTNEIQRMIIGNNGVKANKIK
ncbi:MAG: acyl-CoA dehydrogenase [Lachnospiraceae bacterium]|jgi:alkylation response protein AidB-like acyl-CoA dehydrogenase|nr:acyl-CoA dehydrogenase [Lachnospiraceae bacterium]